MSPTRLHRNRDFILLQAGQLLSNIGTASTAIAYPLLVLGATHSAMKAGFVAFARTLPSALLLIPAGIVADRVNRKWLMLLADGVRVLAIGALVAMIVGNKFVFSVVTLVAFVEGAGAALFVASQPGAMRAVVPVRQLPAAVAAQTGRQAAVDIAGPPIGGALFAIGRAVPFLFDAVSYVFSAVSLLAMRTPFQQARERNGSRLRSQLAEGFRFLWAKPFLRTCALLFSLGNFIGPGLVLAIVVIGRRQGLSSAQIGALSATLGLSLLAGSFASPLLLRLSARTVLLLELWTALGVVAFLVRPNVYVLVAGILPTEFVIPASNSIVHGYRIAMTPDRLLGRAEAVRSTISLAIAPLGPLVAGTMLATTSARTTVALFTVFALVLALWGTFSPSIRAAPSLDQLETLASGGS